MADPATIGPFLEGEEESVRTIRSAIERVVRGFRLGASGREDEAVQEALGRVFLNLAAGRFRGASSLKTYSEAVARNTCRELRRKLGRDVPLEVDELRSTSRWSAPEDSLIREEEFRSDLQVFGCLPANCKKLFYLVFVERLPYSEVARRLGISEGALRLRTHRCRKMCAEARKKIGRKRS